jgi:hypothetical protein
MRVGEAYERKGARGVVVALLLAATQPFPTTCAQVLDELKMRPPSYGDKARAELVWDTYTLNCEEELGGRASLQDVEAMLKLIEGRK